MTSGTAGFRGTGGNGLVKVKCRWQLWWRQEVRHRVETSRRLQLKCKTAPQELWGLLSTGRWGQCGRQGHDQRKEQADSRLTSVINMWTLMCHHITCRGPSWKGEIVTQNLHMEIEFEVQQSKYCSIIVCTLHKMGEKRNLWIFLYLKF